MISAQPATDYYAWQVEVYLENFISLGYNGNFIDVIAGYTSGIPQSWRRIQSKFPYVRFFFYQDTRIDNSYAPSVQSHLLSKHFKQHPYISEEAVFFHDCDFLFTKYFDFSPYLNDNTWYLSDTVSYIGSEYIKSKGDIILDAMCETVGIDKDIVCANNNISGGAQKLMKGVTYQYWDLVYDNSLKLYDTLKRLSDIKKDGDQFGIQYWCASMWAELWVAWKLGFTTNIPRDFDFCWATCSIKKWDDVYFFHNAGVQNNQQGMFFKADYISRFPFNENLFIDPGRCSYNYYRFMKNINTCLI